MKEKGGEGQSSVPSLVRRLALSAHLMLQPIIRIDVIGNKILELPAQVMLAMANAQIVQTGCRFHETI